MSNKPQLPAENDSDLLTIAYMDGYHRGDGRGKGLVINRVQAVVARWRTEADRLDKEAADLSRGCRDADATRKQAKSRLKREMASELERALGGDA